MNSTIDRRKNVTVGVYVFGLIGWLIWPELESGGVGLQPHLAQLESGGGWGYSLTWPI